jgi:hypothetical protein
MDKASAYAKSGLDMAKSNPKTLLALLFSVVLFILVCVNIFSLMGVKDNEVSGASKTKVTNAKRSGYGIGVMALIGCGIAFYNHTQSK